MGRCNNVQKMLREEFSNMPGIKVSVSIGGVEGDFIQALRCATAQRFHITHENATTVEVNQILFAQFVQH